ncbi:oxygen-dependent protoporphyrinogen oxidase [Cytobacillus eiseniae]|uniref:Coproporphyrinogen III oxidase n=1 Tax=Cytobacillus eiseniae TaxID=762947 RepID=A0ABS4RFC6_9BACI|nr:oxygen-dependent protoporphyrinogen oxidase [Cytobacillus eiseniae]
MSEEKQKVIIIGGGIAGLTAAYYLQKEARENHLPLEVKLIEASHRLGGKMQTVIRDGFVIERGPDSFLARKMSASRLAKEVGMEDSLISNTAGKSFIVARERLHSMPGGSIMGIPTEVGPFITTGLFSLPGKMRAATDFILPRSKPNEDQSLGAFFRRRLGNEVVENLIEPLLSGIYAGDIDRLSLLSTFPQFYQVEQKHRSLILGMKKSAPPKEKKVEKKETGGFLTFTKGLQSFIDAIESKLEKDSVLKGVQVRHVQKKDRNYEVIMSDGKSLQADSIIMAVPHHVTQSIFSDYRFFDPFKASTMPSTTVATVALAFPAEAIKKDIDGIGFVVSRNCDYTITACTWTHKKWPHTAPEGKVLLRCYVGRPGDEAVVDVSDDEMIKIVLDDLNKTMNITMDPDFAVISRWRDSMPQYTVGHKERMANAAIHLEKELPGIYLAGSSYDGLGIPDCIDQGEKAVQQVVSFLSTQKAVHL